MSPNQSQHGISTLFDRQLYTPNANTLDLVFHMLPSSGQTSNDQVILYDGICHINAVLLGQHDSPTKVKSCMIRLEGFVVSEANHGLESPILYIAEYSVIRLQTLDQSIVHETRRFKPKKTTIMGGAIASFLNRWAPFLTDNQLSGMCESNRSKTNKHELVTEKYNKVREFLTHHVAMKTLDSLASTNDNDNITRTNAYMSALNEFSLSQMDRQKASLLTNTAKETPERAVQMAHQYRQTLELALVESEKVESLSLECLRRWHSCLCGNGLMGPRNEAGNIRKRNVKTGDTMYCRATEVSSNSRLVFDALSGFEKRFFQNYGNDMRLSDRKVDSLLVFAAAALMGVVDIHPFSDGNGRLSRIVLNWALRRVGFPFVIHLYATPGQRKEFIKAIQSTRRNITLVKRGEVSDEALLLSYQISGAFSPLIELILDCLYKAIREFNKIVQEKVSYHNEQEEAKVARKCREREAQGTCMICFDNTPNIATLCCGKPVHLNCMAEWLSNKNSCPQCRAELPSLPERLMRSSHSASEEDSDIETTTISYGSADSAESTRSFAGFLEAFASAIHDASRTGDDRNVEMEEMADFEEDDFEFYTGTTTEIEDEDEEDRWSQPPAFGGIAGNRLYCMRTNCTNQAARDCDNMSCGRCCVLHGQYNCLRHCGHS